jgi:hypothetical protein
VSRLSVRSRRLLGLLAAVLIAGALVAPVVLSSQSGTSAPPCASRLTYLQHVYRRRAAPAGSTQGVAIGIGVLTGCGRAPANVNVRSIVGMRSAHALAIDGDNGVYVRAAGSR